MKFKLFVFFIFVLGLLSVPALAETVIPDDQIDVPNDVIMLDSPVDQTSVNTVLERLHKLQAVNKDKPIYLLLDSPGGEVLEGMKIIDAMKASKRPVYTVVTGSADSMAAYIHSYGVKRYITPSSELMYHLISMGYSGDIIRLRFRLDHIDRIKNILDGNIAKRSGIPLSEVQAKMISEWWVGADEALKKHLVDDIVISTAFVKKDTPDYNPPKPDNFKFVLPYHQ